MAQKTLIACAVAAVLAVPANTQAEDSTTGPFGFQPIAESATSAGWDPTAPWLIPEGFAQSVVSDETDLNIYDAGRDDWNDMNTVNETGRHAGRYLYRTHELRLPDSLPEGGTVSVVDLNPSLSALANLPRIFKELEFSSGRVGHYI